MLRNYDVIYYEQNSNSKAYFKNKMLLEIEPISDKGIKGFYKDFAGPQSKKTRNIIKRGFFKVHAAIVKYDNTTAYQK